MGFSVIDKQSLRHPREPETAYPRLDFVESGMRFYSPALGRWTRRDPIEEAGGLNISGYLGNRVPNSMDYLGLSDVLVKCPCDEAEIDRVAADAALLAGSMSRRLTKKIKVTGLEPSTGAETTDEVEVSYEYCGRVCCKPDGKPRVTGPRRGHYRVTNKFGDDTFTDGPEGTPTCRKVFDSGEVDCEDDEIHVRDYHSHPSGDLKPSTGDWGHCKRLGVPLLVAGSQIGSRVRMMCSGPPRRLIEIDPRTGERKELDPKTGKEKVTQ